MPLQNRVDPFGAIAADPARGLFTGNRGVIHDPELRRLTGRRWTTKAWIICSCSYKDRTREVMGRNGPNGRAGWTELFFLDEVTALAAGHRPCFTCRREAARNYARAFSTALAIAEPRAPEIDARLHKERLAAGGKLRPLSRRDLAALPDGAMVADGAIAYALRGGRMLQWSLTGYAHSNDAAATTGQFTLITPLTTVSALKAGFRPVWHLTAS